jgi:hypothetical protein
MELGDECRYDVNVPITNRLFEEHLKTKEA